MSRTLNIIAAILTSIIVGISFIDIYAMIKVFRNSAIESSILYNNLFIFITIAVLGIFGFVFLIHLVRFRLTRKAEESIIDGNLLVGEKKEKRIHLAIRVGAFLFGLFLVYRGIVGFFVARDPMGFPNLLIFCFIILVGSYVTIKVIQYQLKLRQ